MIVVAFLMQLAQPTAADLLDKKTINQNLFQAVTIEVKNLDSATNVLKSGLFNIQGMLPNGLAVSSLRIKNTGSHPINVAITSTSNTSEICQHLNSSLLKDWKRIIASQPLLSLEHQLELQPNATEDLVISIESAELPSNIQNQMCNFELVIEARSKHTSAVQFHDTKRLQNQVYFGTWNN